MFTNSLSNISTTFTLPTGLSTGLSVLDNFFPWRGLPLGEISLFNSAPGTGATSLWLKAASRLGSGAKLSAWISSDFQLSPLSQASRGANPQRIVVVSKAERKKNLFAALQTMLTSNLFTLIGCQIRKLSFNVSQLQELKRLANKHEVALVFIAEFKEVIHSAIFSLVVDCHHDFFTVQRAKQRPTPFTISAQMIFSELMPQLNQSLQSRQELAYAKRS